MRVAIIDYGMGNLGSVGRAVAELGARADVVDTPAGLDHADRIILPGVGSFGDGMAHLEAGGWVDPIRRAVAGHTPLLGICLGMHLLASWGREGGDRTGLDLIPGRVRRLDEFGCGERIPHAGWNAVTVGDQGGMLFAGIPSGTDFYFVHSYALDAAVPESVIATTDYGVPLTAAVASGHVLGTQFHPEKSSRAGFRLLKNFLEGRAC
jgi:imidazole glycerol-phosphate synthase subunit HisH